MIIEFFFPVPTILYYTPTTTATVVHGVLYVRAAA